MHPSGPQSDRDEEDVECVEGLIKVVSEETEGRGHQEGEGDERLSMERLVPTQKTDDKSKRLTAQPQTNGG